MRAPDHARRFVRQTWTIIKKDLRREVRSRETILTTVCFSLLLVLIFVFALHGRGDDFQAIFPGIAWVSVLFASTLSIPRTFATERDSGCLRALALIPGTEKSLYVSKLALNILFMLCFEMALLPMLLLTFQVDVSERLGAFALTMFAGTCGFATLGTLVAAMLVHHRLREVLLPLLLYPLLVPVIISGVEACGLIVSGGEAELMWTWIKVMGAADVVFFLGSLALFERGVKGHRVSSGLAHPCSLFPRTMT